MGNIAKERSQLVKWGITQWNNKCKGAQGEGTIGETFFFSLIVFKSAELKEKVKFFGIVSIV